MTDNTIPTRNQIARLVGDDPAMIKALERLFIVANDLTPTEITTLTQLITDNEYATGAADNKADVASSETLAVARMVSDVSHAAGVADNKAEVAMSIAVSAERMASLAATQPITQEDPRLGILGSMAFQNSNAVAITGGTINGAAIGGSSAAAGAFTTLTASGQASFADGTAAAPSISHIGDLNAGMFFPAADTIGFSTGGTERVRIASSGQVGLGGANYGTTGQTIISAGAATAPAWGAIGVDGGGTGITSYTIGDIVYASGTTTLSKLADVAVGSALISGGIGAAPSYGKVGLTTHVSGTLGVGNGGTGQASNLTQYGVVYGSTTTAMATSAAGTTTQVLHGNAAGAPTFGAVSLTADVSGTLPVLNGGTGVTTSTGTGSNVLSASPALTGNVTVSTNSATAALQITQIGAGPALLVEDSASVDATPFIIDASGNVGIGNTTPVTPLHVTGASITTGVTYLSQPAQTSKAAATTLTIAELLTGIIQYTGVAATLTLPTGTNIEGGLPATFPTNMSFDVSFINTGGALLTIGANGNTTVGTMTVATLTSARLRFRKTAANTYTVYRIS